MGVFSYTTECQLFSFKSFFSRVVSYCPCSSFLYVFHIFRFGPLPLSSSPAPALPVPEALASDMQSTPAVTLMSEASPPVQPLGSDGDKSSVCMHSKSPGTNLSSSLSTSGSSATDSMISEGEVLTSRHLMHRQDDHSSDSSVLSLGQIPAALSPGDRVLAKVLAENGSLPGWNEELQRLAGENKSQKP